MARTRPLAAAAAAVLLAWVAALPVALSEITPEELAPEPEPVCLFEGTVDAGEEGLPIVFEDEDEGVTKVRTGTHEHARARACTHTHTHQVLTHAHARARTRR